MSGRGVYSLQHNTELDPLRHGPGSRSVATKSAYPGEGSAAAILASRLDLLCRRCDGSIVWFPPLVQFVQSLAGSARAFMLDAKN